MEGEVEEIWKEGGEDAKEDMWWTNGVNRTMGADPGTTNEDFLPFSHGRHSW
jgi:hypothetical protein